MKFKALFLAVVREISPRSYRKPKSGGTHVNPDTREWHKSCLNKNYCDFDTFSKRFSSYLEYRGHHHLLGDARDAGRTIVLSG